MIFLWQKGTSHYCSLRKKGGLRESDDFGEDHVVFWGNGKGDQSSLTEYKDRLQKIDFQCGRSVGYYRTLRRRKPGKFHCAATKLLRTHALLPPPSSRGRYATDLPHEVFDRRSTLSELKPNASQYSSSSTSLSCLSSFEECYGSSWWGRSVTHLSEFSSDDSNISSTRAKRCIVFKIRKRYATWWFANDWFYVQQFFSSLRFFFLFPFSTFLRYHTSSSCAKSGPWVARLAIFVAVTNGNNSGFRASLATSGIKTLHVASGL